MIDDGITRKDRESFYAMMLEQAHAHGEAQYKQVARALTKDDLYFLLIHILNRKDILANPRQADFVFDRCRDVQKNPNDNIDLWSRGHFKAIHQSELVPTPNGFRTHGDLVPGNFVFDPHGKPVKVVAKTEVFKDAPCVYLGFDDGARVVCSQDHLWRIKVGKHGRFQIKSAYDIFGLYAGGCNLWTQDVVTDVWRKPGRKIVLMKLLAPEPVSCIQVDSKDGMYLVGLNYIPTHNSTIITQALTIQEILKDPELTFCIFSFTRPIAKGFLRLIKREFETNEKLKALFPDVLWKTPRSESPKWSENEGIVVRRKGNPVEATVEAWGLTDGQPTSRHFKRLIYDDVVTDKSVNTPEMMQKVVDGWRLSLNLVSLDYKVRYIGTRYHANDMYGYLIDEGVANPRLIPATDDGTPTGEPVMWSRDLFQQKYREMKEYTASCQLLQNPLIDKMKGFDYKNLQFWRPMDLYQLNKYILVDPANEKRKTNDYTSMWCVGLGTDRNYYVIDILRDRLNLTERTNKLMEWISLYSPLRIGYERYGMQADIQHIEYVMTTTNFRFHGKLIELGGATKKSDRIGSLEPIFRAKRVYLPEHCFYTNYEGRKQDLVKVFIDEEYNAWPVPKHDDMLDALQRVLHPDLNAQFPPTQPIEENLTVAQRDALKVRGRLEKNTTSLDEGFEGLEAI